MLALPKRPGGSCLSSEVREDCQLRQIWRFQPFWPLTKSGEAPNQSCKITSDNMGYKSKFWVFRLKLYLTPWLKTSWKFHLLILWKYLWVLFIHSHEIQIKYLIFKILNALNYTPFPRSNCVTTQPLVPGLFGGGGGGGWWVKTQTSRIWRKFQGSVG